MHQSQTFEYRSPRLEIVVGSPGRIALHQVLTPRQHREHDCVPVSDCTKYCLLHIWTMMCLYPTTYCNNRTSQCVARRAQRQTRAGLRRFSPARDGIEMEIRVPLKIPSPPDDLFGTMSSNLETCDYPILPRSTVDLDLAVTAPYLPRSRCPPLPSPRTPCLKPSFALRAARQLCELPARSLGS